MLRPYLTALDRLDATVEEVGDSDWDAPTPCAGWSVRDLLNHMTAEALWAPHLYRGETLEEVGGRYDGDVLGSDPLGAWRRATAGEREAVEAADALEGTVHTSMGELPATEYAMQRLTDLVVHRWDLARGIGADDTVDEAAASVLYEHWKPQQALLAGSGVFAEPVEVPADAPAGVKLLGLLGRRP